MFTYLFNTTVLAQWTDQPRALFASPDRDELKAGRMVEEPMAHCAVTVLPTRPAHPCKKPRVEVGVQIVER